MFVRNSKAYVWQIFSSITNLIVWTLYQNGNIDTYENIAFFFWYQITLKVDLSGILLQRFWITNTAISVILNFQLYSSLEIMTYYNTGAAIQKILSIWILKTRLYCFSLLFIFFITWDIVKCTISFLDVDILMLYPTELLMKFAFFLVLFQLKYGGGLYEFLFSDCLETAEYRSFGVICVILSVCCFRF